MERKVTMNKVDEYLERKLAERRNEIFEANKKKKSFWGNFSKRKPKLVNTKTQAAPKQQISSEPRLSPEQQLIMDLFNKIKDNFISNSSDKSLPKHITIGIFGIDLVYNDGSKKTLEYSEYIHRGLEIYSGYWCTDGSKSEETLNEPLFLANQINKFVGNIYDVLENTRRTEKRMPNNVTMIIYTQESIKMYKK